MKPCAKCQKPLTELEQFGRDYLHPLCQSCHWKQEDKDAENAKNKLQDELDELESNRTDLELEIYDLEERMGVLRRKMKETFAPIRSPSGQMTL